MQEEDAAGVIDGREEGVGKLSTYTSIEKDIISPCTCIKYYIHSAARSLNCAHALITCNGKYIKLTCLQCTHSK